MLAKALPINNRQSKMLLPLRQFDVHFPHISCRVTFFTSLLSTASDIPIGSARIQGLGGISAFPSFLLCAFLDFLVKVAGIYCQHTYEENECDIQVAHAGVR